MLEERQPDRHRTLRAHIEELWHGDRCDIRRCRACGLGFAVPFIAGNAAFYELAYPRVDYPKSKWEYERTLRALEHRPIEGTTALEIGAGFGWFLDALSPARLAPNRILAIEYSEDAQRTLRRKGYSVAAADLRSDEFVRFAGHFDLVFMFQILEHMDRLDELFARLHLLTAEGADLFIAVPNPNWIAFNERHGALLDMPPNHIGRWTGAAFAAIAARHGFVVAEMDREPFRAMRFIRSDIVFSFLRKAQRRGSLANRLRSRPRSATTLALQATLMAIFAVGRVPVWLTARRHADEVGEAIWIHLHRPRN